MGLRQIFWHFWKVDLDNYSPPLAWGEVDYRLDVIFYQIYTKDHTCPIRFVLCFFMNRLEVLCLLERSAGTNATKRVRLFSAALQSEMNIQFLRVWLWRKYIISASSFQ